VAPPRDSTVSPACARHVCKRSVRHPVPKHDIHTIRYFPKKLSYRKGFENGKIKMWVGARQLHHFTSVGCRLGRKAKRWKCAEILGALEILEILETVDTLETEFHGRCVPKREVWERGHRRRYEEMSRTTRQCAQVPLAACCQCRGSELAIPAFIVLARLSL